MYESPISSDELNNPFLPVYIITNKYSINLSYNLRHKR